MSYSKFVVLTVVLSILLSVQCFGQDSATQVEELQSKVDSLQSTIANIDKRITTWEKIKRHFKISGFVQGGYEWTDTSTSSFYVRRARVSFMGSIFEGTRGAYADYRLQVDFAGSPKIVDCYIRYSPINAFGIQIGEFKLPLTIEHTEYAPPLRLEFIESSLAVRRLVRTSSDDVTGISSAGRDIGAQLYGGLFKKNGYNIINYNIAVFNGNGINKKDDNKSKDFVGRIMVNPTRNLTLGAYYQYGEGCYLVSPSKYTVLHRYGGGAVYDCADFFIRGEYLGGKTGSMKSDGAYIAGGYRFLKKWATVARVDYFDTDNRDNSREWNYTVGMNYMPWKYLRIQLNYTFIHYIEYDIKNTNSLNMMVTAIF